MARYRRLCHLVGLLLLISATTALKCPERGGTPGRELVCYTSSKDLERLENVICHCTTLVHQGHDLQNLSASDVKSLRDGAKKVNPDIRVVLSVSDKDELLKGSANTRKDAVSYVTNILNEVDGIELNVTAGSKERLVSFVKGLKDEMVNKSVEKMILLVLPTKPEDLAKQFELKELSKYVDLFTVATHYLRDNDESYRAFHPSRLMGLFDMLNTDSLVDLISGMGAPKQKILISAPTSAYRFTLKKAEDNTPRSSAIEEQPVVLDRKTLCDEMNVGEWTVERDEDLTAPYAFKNTSWIAFEDETSLKIKGKYVILRELAGLGLRDVENDLKNKCGVSLAQSVNKAFSEMKRQTRDVVLSSLERDLKGTEIAYPEHVRSSDFRIVRVVDTEGKIRAVRENTQTAFACSRQGYFVHPKSCNRFYRCVKFNQEIDDYSVFEFDCPAGLAFDDRTEVCVWPGSLSRGSACPGSSEIEPVPRGRFRCPSHPGFYADPQNCRWFFACYDLGGPEMIPYEFRCPFGLVFDEHRLVCEWPWKVSSCKSHGNGYSVYNYGGGYGGQDGQVAHGGVIGLGGFVGQGGYAEHGLGDSGSYGQDGQGVAYGSGPAGVGGAYDGQTYGSGGTGAGYDGQTYAAGFGTGAGAGYGGQTYNAGAAAGAGVGYGGQTYNAGGAAGAGVGYGGQTYNAGGAAGAGAGYDAKNFNAAGGFVSGAGFDGQTYASGFRGAAGTGTGYDGQTYSPGGVAGAGAGYDAKNFNAAGGSAAGAGYDGQTYNSVGFGSAAGAGYDGQSYNADGVAGSVGAVGSAGASGTGAGYDKQTFNAGAAYDGQTHNVGISGSGADYDGQSFSAGGAAGAGADYDSQTYAGGAAGTGAGHGGHPFNSAGATGTGAGYDGQTFNSAGASGTGAGYDGQTFNAAGAAGTGAGYDGQTFNAAGAAGSGAGYDGQTFSAAGAGYDGQTFNAAGAAYDGKNFNAGGTAGTGAGHDGQSFNAGGAGGAGADYDGQTFNAAGAAGAGAAYDGKNFNAGGTAGTGAGHDGQSFNAGGAGGAGADYDGQTFNAAGAAGAGAAYDGKNFNDGGTAGTDAGHDGQSFNAGGAGGAGADYDGQTFNAAGAAGAGAAYDGKNFNDGGTAGHDGQSFNAGGAGGAGADYDGQTYDGGDVGTGAGYDGQSFNAGGSAGAGADYDGQNYNTGGAGAGFSGQNAGVDCDGQTVVGPDANGQDYNGQNFGGNGAGYDGNNDKGIGVNAGGFKGQNANAGGADSDQGIVTTSADYDDRRGGTAGFNQQGTVYTIAGRGQTTQFNSGDSQTTVGVNNFAGVTRTPTGFTSGPANFGNTIYTTGYAGGANTAGTTKGVFNTGLTTSGQAQNTNYNAFDSTAQTGAGERTQNVGISTVGYGNTAGTGLLGIGNTEYTGGIGPTVYNATYNANAGYPTSTIIPFQPRPNTLNTPDYQGTPVNSVIYHAQLAMGLTSTENFGKEYANQAEKSFATKGRTPAGFAFNGQTQNTQKYNTANLYDKSKVNLAGVSPSITLERDGVYNGGGATSYSGSTVGTTNFNAGAGATSGYGNSQIMGSSVTSANNDILKFQENSGIPETYGNTLSTTGYRTDSVGTNFFNQGTSVNQNSFTGTGFSRAPGFSTVTPPTILESFNTQSTPAPVIPLNTGRPAIELDNSGIFGTNFAGSTTIAPGVKTTNFQSTTVTSGYRTNEYFDNGGRGTIRYNNGIVANKVGENDLPDYRPSTSTSYTRIPNSFIINAGNGENEQSTIQKNDDSSQQVTDGTFTRGGFTKTGPTKTGITTAQVGGSGSYVIGTGLPRARPNPQYIGEQAFAGNVGTTGSANFGAAGNTASFGTTSGASSFGTAGESNTFGSRGTAGSFGTTGTATNFGSAEGVTNFGVEGSTANFGTSGGLTATQFSNKNTASETVGYSYPKPLVQLEVNGLSTTPGVTQPNYLDSTTPTSFSNSVQSFDNKNSVIIESNAQNGRGYSSTISPIGFTTGQLENFRTTVYQAAKLPQTISTVRPVIDNGYQTVISSTPLPVVVTSQKQAYQTDNISTTPRTYLDVGVSFNQEYDYNSAAQGSTGASDYSDITSNFDQGNFGQKIAGQTRFTNTNYQSPVTTSRLNQNSPLITSTQGDFNAYTQTGTDTTARTGSLRTNTVTDFGTTVTIPKQVYLPSSTIAPEIGVTFRKPIVAAEFAPGQFEGSTVASISQNSNAITRGSANPFLNNQIRGQIAPQRPNGVAVNQASADFAARGQSNTILRNQANAGFASQGSPDGQIGNQASADFAARGQSNTILRNQANAGFAPYGSAGGVVRGQGSADFASRGTSNRILNNQVSGGFASQGSADGQIGNQASADFAARGQSNTILRNQANAGFASQGSVGGVVRGQGSADFASRGTSNRILNNQVPGGFASQDLGSGVFNSQSPADFASRGSANQFLNNQASGEFASQGSLNGGFGTRITGGSSQGSAPGAFGSQASFADQNKGYNAHTRTLIGSNVVTSFGGANIDESIIRQGIADRGNVKIVTEFDGQNNANIGRGSVQSTTFAPEITTYAGGFSRKRVESNSGFNTRTQNKKVIVKLSDLHPLILGKLGAECTCRADPFSVFRGPSRQPLPINSQNRGRVDLANYDESDIYVDVDGETQKEIDFAKSIPSNRLLKTSNSGAIVNEEKEIIVVNSRGEPSSSTYLPPTTIRPSTYLPPPRPSTAYLPSSTELPFTPALRENQASLNARAQSRQPLLIRVESDNLNIPAVRGRAGKALFESAGSANGLRNQGESFDRYGPGGLRSNDETLLAEFDCARPGLFRHPKFCNKFYACHWDEWKKRYTLHVFNCPVHLAFDSSAGACNYPSKGPACQDNKLLL